MSKVICRRIFIFVFTMIVMICLKYNINGFEKEEENIIVATNFIGYDFARELTKNTNYSINMLIKPGTEVHTYDPTPQDIIKILKSKLFIYVGGESDEWVDKLLLNLETSSKFFKIMDFSSNYREQDVETKQFEDSYDEHVWTSPKNVLKIVEGIKNVLIQTDLKNKKIIEKNYEDYVKKINDIDEQITNIVLNSDKKQLIFADRFPFIYFVKDYGLDYVAAFPGCSSNTEANAKTVASIISSMKSSGTSSILYF